MQNLFFCDIYSEVNIDQKGSGKENNANVPTIGNCIWIEPTYKLFG